MSVVRPRPVSGRVSRYSVRTHAGNVLFMLPAFLFFAFVVLVPFLQGIPYSFMNWKSIVSVNKPWIGLRNYEVLLNFGAYQKFGYAFLHTFHFTALYIVAANALGLALALMLWRSSRFNNAARTMLFMPFTVALVSASLVWTYVYTDIYTPLTGIASPLGKSDQVINGLVAIATWRDMGYCMLIYIAALQSIPQDYYEAARVEGAHYRHELFNITVPMIVPAFTANITLLLAWGLKCFDYPMSAARNMATAETTAMFVYDNIFGFDKAGFGQAAAITMTFVLVVLSFVVTSILRSREVEM